MGDVAAQISLRPKVNLPSLLQAVCIIGGTVCAVVDTEKSAQPSVGKRL